MKLNFKLVFSSRAVEQSLDRGSGQSFMASSMSDRLVVGGRHISIRLRGSAR